MAPLPYDPVAALTFLHPALLVGLAAAAVPIIIHFVTRPRPRRVRFPAIALLHSALQTGQRSQHLRNWLLLALRAGLIGLLALFLAGPRWSNGSPSTNAAAGAGATVIVFDDSLSTHYETAASRVLYDDLHDAVQNLIAASGSPTALSAATTIVRTSQPESAAPRTLGQPAPLSGDSIASRPPLLPSADAAVLRASSNAAPLGEALRIGLARLRASPQANRRLIIVTDLAAHAWRDVPPDLLHNARDIDIRVIGPVDLPRTNIGITSVRGIDRAISSISPARLSATIWSSGIAAPAEVTATALAAAPRAFDSIVLRPNEANPQPIELPPAPPGAHGFTLRLSPIDRLPFDQVRYAVWQSAPPPPVWLIVDDPATARADLSVRLFRNLLAPEDLPRTEQLLDFQMVPARDLPARIRAIGAPAVDESNIASAESRAVAAPVAILIFSNTPLDAATADALLRLVERGSTLLLAPRSAADTTVQDWPALRRLLSESPPRSEALQPTGSLVLPFNGSLGSLSANDADSREPRTGGTQQPRSEAPDTTASVDSPIAVRRRLVFDRPLPDAAILVRYEDQTPAVLGRRLGRGRVVLLSTSPDPRWSDLGREGASLLTWCFDLIDAAAGPPGAVADFEVDHTAPHVFKALPANALVRVSSETDPEFPVRWLRLTNGAPPAGWPAEHPGIYRVSSGREDQFDALYAVNWPGAESDLQPITPAEIAARLGLPEVRVDDLSTVTRDPGAALGFWARLTTDPTQLVAALLLLLFIAESLWSTRGPRQSPPS